MTTVTFRQPYMRPPWRTRPADDVRPRDRREDYESAAFYNPGDVAGFPDEEAAYLCACGLATPTLNNPDGGNSEKGSDR